MTNSLWVEAYRPKTTDGYVFANESHRQKVEQWITEKNIPHLLFDGPPGTGKTTLATILIENLDVDQYDVMKINASRENNVDTMRNRISNFVETMPFGKFKIVLLDEADFMSPGAMAGLRGIMEQYASTSRFILTCNHPNKIIPAIHSRTQRITIEKLDINAFTENVAKILLAEDIEFDLETLDDFVRAAYPDMRKCIQNVQLNSINKILTVPQSGSSDSKDFQIEAIQLFKQGKIREARQLICKQIRPDQMDEFFRTCYDNIDLFGKTDEQQDEAILIIRKGLINHALCSDPEINISAMLVEISQIK